MRQNIYEKIDGLNRVGKDNESFSGLVDFCLLATLVILIAAFAFRMLTRSGARRASFTKAKLVPSPSARLAPGSDVLLSWDGEKGRASCGGVLLTGGDEPWRFVAAANATVRPPGGVAARLVGREMAEVIFVDVTTREGDGALVVVPAKRPPRSIRAAARIDCSLKAAALPPGAPDVSDGIFLRIVNIGVKGLGVVCESELTAGRRLAVRFLIPGQRDAISVTVRVVWASA